jgi:hypothetical protein
MIIKIAAAIVAGLIVSIFQWFLLLWFTPNFCSNKVVRMLLAVPVACGPVALGLLISILASRIVGLDTKDDMAMFVHVWLGMCAVTFVIIGIKIIQLRKTGEYWK